MALSKITNASVADTAIYGRRNLIINGAMQVAQRATSKTAQTSGGIHTVDRFFLEESGATFDIAQVSDAPDGFQYSQKVTMSGAFTPTASQYIIPFEQRIEKQNLTHLAYGTSNAKSVTLSFWIKSNKTGTYVVEFSNNNATRKWSQSYTIDTADTWEHKTLTWTGDTSGSLGTGNGIGATFFWWMTAGTTFTSGALSGAWETETSANRAVGVPTSLADDDEFYLTGVQLEVGDTATPFEHRSYGEELALCQRYYTKSGNIGTSTEWFAGVATYAGYGGNMAQCIDGNQDRLVSHVKFPCYMRARPTVTYYPARSDVTNTSGKLSKYNGASTTVPGYFPSGDCNGLFGYFSSVGTDYVAYSFHYTADAEL